MTQHTLAKFKKVDKQNKNGRYFNLPGLGVHELPVIQYFLGTCNIEAENKAGSYHTTQARNRHPPFSKLPRRETFPIQFGAWVLPIITK